MEYTWYHNKSYGKKPEAVDYFQMVGLRMKLGSLTFKPENKTP